MLLSRTPQPAIDIGTVAINSTGGIRKRTCANPTGAATALTQHQAALIVNRWIMLEHPITIAADRSERHVFTAASAAAAT